MFEPNYQLSGLSPAPYNPRVIEAPERLRLLESIKALGLIKPVIVTKQGILVAGHQRTVAMKAAGYSHCPAFLLPTINQTDEIRFNQLHNASDLEFSEAAITIPVQLECGWVQVKPSDIQGPSVCKNASKRNEILRLLSKYGEWGSVVATQSGEVIVSALYAISSRTLNMPLLCYIVPDNQKESVLFYFGHQYGKFSYEHLPRTTWGQSLAQMMRLRNEESGKGKSRTYEKVVMPRISRDMRVLDFGAGQMDYVKQLKSQGYNIRGVEFYFRTGSQVNISQVHRDIDALCKDLKANGRYDLVVCDSVLNSVDSVQSEQDVLVSLNALCRPGGTIVFSGRSRDFVEYISKNLKSYGTSGMLKKQHVVFIDENGLSASFAGGVWRYQKYHMPDEVRGLAAQYTGDQFTLTNNDGKEPKTEFKASGWCVEAQKTINLTPDQFLPGLRREFDLPLPGGQSYKRSGDIESAVLVAIAQEML